MNRHKFHDFACQGNLKICQGIVREMSGNFVSAGEWQPCIMLWELLLYCWNYPDSLATTTMILELPHLKNGDWLFNEELNSFPLTKSSLGSGQMLSVGRKTRRM